MSQIDFIIVLSPLVSTNFIFLLPVTFLWTRQYALFKLITPINIAYIILFTKRMIFSERQDVDDRISAGLSPRNQSSHSIVLELEWQNGQHLPENSWKLTWSRGLPTSSFLNNNRQNRLSWRVLKSVHIPLGFFCNSLEVTSQLVQEAK